MAEDRLIFSVGDVVWLKSGGPAMTVTLSLPSDQDLTSVEWFVNDLVQRDTFFTDSLTSKNPNKAI